MAALPKGIKHHYTCVSELGNSFPQRSEFALLGYILSQLIYREGNTGLTAFPPYYDGPDISHAVAPGYLGGWPCLSPCP
jgi:hypothetical protein